MSEKSRRQEAIVRLIHDSSIETQEDLAEALRIHGFQVTQATVSRDIREMNLTKAPAPEGGYQYTVPEKQSRVISDRLNRMLSDSLVSVRYTDSLVVVKTLSGTANTACEALDTLDWPENMGTIAGDNTIFMAVRDAATAKEIADRILQLIHH